MGYKEIAAGIPRIGATQEWVFHVIKQGITTGELAGGMQLKQDEISEALEVSHIPVREALRQLEARGLVKIMQNRGAYVTKLSRNVILDMMEVRANLSVMLFRSSAPMLTEEDYAELEQIVAEQAKETELFGCEELNYRFHEILGSHADNSIADLFLGMIHDNIDRYMRHNFYGDGNDRQRSLNEHRAILDACHRGDYESAAALLNEHILRTRDYIPEDIDI